MPEPFATVAGAGGDARRLAGRTVLLPRLREPDALAEALERAGATVVRAALTRTVSSQSHTEQLDAVCRDLATGNAAWLVLTSARTVEALAARLPRALRADPGLAGGTGSDIAASTSTPAPRARTSTGTRTAKDAQVDDAGAAVGTGTRSDPPRLPATAQTAAIDPATAQAAASDPATVRVAAVGPATTQAAASGPATVQAAAIDPATVQAAASDPATVRVAAVGPATARAWERLTGSAPDVVASGSAAALLTEPALAAGPRGARTASPGSAVRTGAQGPGPVSGPRSPSQVAATQDPASLSARRPTGAHTSSQAVEQPASARLLLPASALADPALAQGLGRAGWEVQQVEAYTTVSVSPEHLPAGLMRRWQDGDVDAVVLTAPSTTRALLELLGPPAGPTRVVAIGATTARATQVAGTAVDAVAASPTPAGVCQAVEHALRAHQGHQATTPGTQQHG